MNNIKAYKKFIYLLIFLLTASCTRDSVKSLDTKKTSETEANTHLQKQMIQNVAKKTSETKANITNDPAQIFIHKYKDNKNNGVTNNKRESATITAVGDVILNLASMKMILDKRIQKKGKQDAMSYPFSKVKQEMEGIGFCNLEAPITNLDVKYFNDKNEVFYFKSPSGSEEILKNGYIDVVSLANNHVMDAGKEGMLDTYKRLQKNDIIPVGVGNNIEEALKPVYINYKGTIIAIFAFSTVIPRSVWAGPDKAGTAGGSGELLCAAVKKVSSKVDAIFVSIHWGEEADTDFPVKEPEREQVELAHKLIDAGAACIVGHHSHALGPVERYKGGIIFYSLGDFIFAGRHSASHTTSIMAQITLSKSGLESYTLIPVNINPYEVEYAPEILDEKRGREVIDRIFSKDKDSKDKDSKDKDSKDKDSKDKDSKDKDSKDKDSKDKDSKDKDSKDKDSKDKDSKDKVSKDKDSKDKDSKDKISKDKDSKDKDSKDKISKDKDSKDKDSKDKDSKDKDSKDKDSKDKVSKDKVSKDKLSKDKDSKDKDSKDKVSKDKDSKYIDYYKKFPDRILEIQKNLTPVKKGFFKNIHYDKEIIKLFSNC